jgi:hypothetical protein
MIFSPAFWVRVTTSIAAFRIKGWYSEGSTLCRRDFAFNSPYYTIYYSLFSIYCCLFHDTFSTAATRGHETMVRDTTMVSRDVQDRSPWPCLMSWYVLIRQLIWVAMNRTKQVDAIEGKEMLQNVCCYDQQLPQNRGRFYLKVDFFFPTKKV